MKAKPKYKKLSQPALSLGIRPRVWFGFALVSAILLALIYGRGLNYDFLMWDDELHILENPFLHSWAGVGHLWQNGYFNMYIPLSYSVWAGLIWISHAFSETLSPVVFHLSNLVLHLINTLLVFRLLMLFLSREPTTPAATPLTRPEQSAALGALVYALHPIQVGSVAWISALRDLFATMLVLLCMLSYAHYRLQQKLSSFWLATAAFILALTAKPLAVVAPALAMVIDLGLLRLNWRRSLQSLWSWLTLAIAFIFIAKSLQSDVLMEYVTPFLQRPLIAGDALSFYARQIVLPLHLASDYGRTPQVALASNDIYVTWLSLVIVMAAFWLTRKSLTAMGLAIFVVTLAPVLGFVPFIFQAYSTVSDNYLYLPLAGVALIVANGLNTTSHQWPKIAVTIWLIILGALSFHQLSYWQNNLIFFNHVLEVNPQSTEALNNLARQLQNQGQTDQALALYERSLTLAPGNMVGLANYAGCLVALKRYPEAIAFIERALQGHISRDKAPRSLAALNVNLTVAYLNTAHLDLAEQSALRAVEINPNMAMSFYALGLVRKSQGRRDKALIQLQHAVQIEPQNAGFRAALLAAQNGSP